MIDVQSINRPNFIKDFIEAGDDEWMHEVKMGDGKVHTISGPDLIINSLIWSVLFRAECVPTSEHVVCFDVIDDDSYLNSCDALYNVLKETDKFHYTYHIESIWNAINNLYTFILKSCGEFQESIDIIGLAKLHEHPKLKHITHRKFSSELGTRVAENEINTAAKEMIDILGDPDALDENCLLPFIITGSLKTNQIPQVLIAYGARSDIDDTMVSHVISESAMSGLKSVEDYVTECLSAKKASYFTKAVIKGTQYFARCMRLVCAQIDKIYMEPCGNTKTIKHIIRPDHARNYIDKNIIYEGKRIRLTNENVNDYTDRMIELVSPLHCRHKDGICIDCAGRGNMDFYKYLPPDISIGTHSATHLGRQISQNVLSTKHLIRTNSVQYNLNATTERMFNVNVDSIHWNPGKMNGLSIRITSGYDTIQHINDIQHGNVDEVEFSSIANMTIIDASGTESELDFISGKIIPYFSNEFIDHMRMVYDDIVVDEGTITIPMKGWDTARAFMRYVVINDDMKAFASSVMSFFKTNIKRYTCFERALRESTDTLFQKLNMNIFHLEVILKAFLDHDQYMEDGTIRFESMIAAIENSSVSMKLGHERIGESDYMSRPDTLITDKGEGIYDPMFAFNLQNIPDYW